MGNYAIRPDLGNLLFRAWSKVDGQYHHLQVDVYTDTNYDPDAWLAKERGPYYNNILTFTWQGSKGHDDWYAFRINANENTSLERIEQGLKLLRRIYRGEEKHHQFSPWEINARMMILNAVQVIYDPRTSDITPIDEVPDYALEGWYALVDDIEGVSSHHGVVLAPNVREAQALILIQYSTEGAEGEAKAFIDAGEPVKQISFRGQNPDIRPLRQIAQLPWMLEDNAEESDDDDD